jgi:hypothetical protein
LFQKHTTVRPHACFPPQTNAYIVWSLVAAGETGLDKEVDALVKLAKEDPVYSSDPYFLGLVSATLFEVPRLDTTSCVHHLPWQSVAVSMAVFSL